MLHYISSTSWLSAANFQDLGRLVASFEGGDGMLPLITNLVYDHGDGVLRFPEIPLRGFKGLELGRVQIAGRWKGGVDNFDEMKRIVDACDVPTLPPWIELSFSVSYEEKTGVQKPNYGDFVKINISQKLIHTWYAIMDGTTLRSSLEDAIEEIVQFTRLCHLPLAFYWINENTMDVVSEEEGVVLPVRQFQRNSRFGPQLQVEDLGVHHLAQILEGSRIFVQNRAKRIFHTSWDIRTIAVKNPDGTWDEAMPYMVEDLIRRFNRLGFGGRKLCAETSGIQFLEPAGYDLARVLLWEGETQYLPLVKFQAEKRDCMLNGAVSREGARLAVSVRKPLKPETLADIARRLEIPFDPDPVESR